MRAISAEFRSVGFSVSLCRPVPDKFVVGDPLGSFRGLSRGCGMVSSFPLYSFESPVIDSRLWSSQRIHFGVVQVGVLAVTMVTIYLWPNAPLTSRRYIENCEIISAGVQLVRSVSGPVLLAGDFNSPLTCFDEMKGLLNDGWIDAALFDANRRGEEPEPTCKRATRHTFCVVSPTLVPMLHGAWVGFHEDLSAHAVLVTEFELPATNPRVYKWMLPKPLDTLPIDHGKLQSLVGSVGPERWHRAVYQPLEASRTDEAFANWSEIAEALLLTAVTTDQHDVSKPSWAGRGKYSEPVLRTWAPPRFHSGRAGDFRLDKPSVALEARRWQKLVRQLEALLRKLRVGDRRGNPRSFGEEVQCIWRAVVGSPVRPRFPRWAFDKVGFEVHLVPCPEILEVLYNAAAAHAQDVAKRCWAEKREVFAEQVQDSWRKRGGSFAFKLLREQPHPPVMEMKVRTEVLLAPQRWLPDGKQWIRVRNAADFHTGDQLEGRVQCQVMEVQEDALRLDNRVSRQEAASLERVEISLDPAVWTKAFFRGWSNYWQRDGEQFEGAPWKNLLAVLPPDAVSRLEDVTFQDWQSALGRAKAASMRGTCGWSVTELRCLPEEAVLPLLRIFTQVERGMPWPKQLQQWLVILLRKEEGIPEWSSVRPISVASVVYRVWSRIRTRQLLMMLQCSALPTVGPRLSTRSLWGFVADYVAEEMYAGKAPSGLVLDIVKAFNVMCRPMVGDVMCHCGVDRDLVDAWLRGLDGMERYVLVAGHAYRADSAHRAATVGVPEGDPLSVVAMYCMCRFFATWIQSKAAVLPLTYADNWQIMASQVEPILTALPFLHEFLEKCALPISPQKCWMWSATRQGRKVLRDASMGDHRIPVKLQSVDLGADLPYCKKRAAAKRNARVRLGHRRLQRARGVPCSRMQKTRLILSGVWPQCLHGAETCQVPLSVLKRLRTQAGRVASLAKPGVSPWIACSVGACLTVDPAFCLLIQRVRLLRLMWRDFPHARDRMRRGLHSLRGGTGGVSYLLAKQMRTLGWLVVGLTAQDDLGRSFHLIVSPLKVIRRVLETSWLDNVAANTRHRKACEHLQSIDAAFSRTWQRYPLEEQALLLTQITGVTYTRDCLSHAVGLEVSRACPLCGQDDSRLHRAQHCQAVQDLRAPFLAMLGSRVLPAHTWAYGLWDEPAGLRDWQADTCQLAWPFVPVSTSRERHFLFTDGSCLSPRDSKLSISGGAVVLAFPTGQYEVVWSGLVPGLDQSSYRAELLAITVALASFQVATVFCDNQQVVRGVTRLLKLPAERRLGQAPLEHRDLWSLFCRLTSERSWGPSVVRWVKAHRNPAGLVGEERILAIFNGHADAEAKKVVVARARSAAYRELFCAVQADKELTTSLADMHVAIAKAFIEVDRPIVVQLEVAGFSVCGRGSGVGPLEAGAQVHEAFGRVLCEWLSTLRWYPSSAAGWTCMSALELLWQFVFDTGRMPPFWYEGRWRLLEESALNSFVLPRMSQLFRTWVQALRSFRALDFEDGSAGVVPFGGSGLSRVSVRGRVPLAPAVAEDLSLLSRRSVGVRSLRFPSFW